MSFQIAKVKGVPVRLHFTLIIVFFLIAWTLARQLMPRYFPNLTTVEDLDNGIYRGHHTFHFRFSSRAYALGNGLALWCEGKARSSCLFLAVSPKYLKKLETSERSSKLPLRDLWQSCLNTAPLAISWWLASQITPAGQQTTGHKTSS